jgi:hypothetical protein
MSIRHIYPGYVPRDPDALRRNKVAALTWRGQPWLDCPILDEKLPKLFVEGEKKLPFVRDVFDAGCKGAPDSDIVVYTNSDTQVRSDTCGRLAGALQDSDAVYCYRRDFHHRLEAPVPDLDFVKGVAYPGTDLYAFRVWWWKSYGYAYPDMIVGLEAWDPVMRTLIDMTNPNGKTMVHDLIAHERHNSFWERAENRYTLQGQILCLRNARAWLLKYGFDPDRFHIRAV